MPWRNVIRPRPNPVPLATPLTWVGGGALLMLSLWLTGVIALVRAFARLVG